MLRGGEQSWRAQLLSPYWLRYHTYWPSSCTQRSRQVPRWLWSKISHLGTNSTPVGICEADLSMSMPLPSRSSSSCLGSSSSNFFKRSPGSAEFWSQSIQDTLTLYHLRIQGENELLQVPQDTFSQPAWFPFLQPPPAQTGRPGFDQNRLPSSPMSALKASSQGSL